MKPSKHRRCQTCGGTIEAHRAILCRVCRDRKTHRGDKSQDRFYQLTIAADAGKLSDSELAELDRMVEERKLGVRAARLPLGNPPLNGSVGKIGEMML